jgi:hypothetical protein
MPGNFEEKLFDVEHLLLLHASNFVAMSAAAIYENEAVRPHLDQIRDCHIYLIGLTPKVEIADLKQDGNDLVAVINVANVRHELQCALPPQGSFVSNSGAGLVVQNGREQVLASDIMMTYLHREQRAIGFEVLYIGQAYGTEGSRNALQRLRTHETLQKISIKGIPDGYALTILMLIIESGHSLMTVFNPFAKDASKGEQRIDAGALFRTTEAERISIYEASLIRYFQPPFNKEFKNSFPSTNMKLLAECYGKDFLAVVAEICLDGLPFTLFSKAVPREFYHIAMHDLHSESDRKLFFFE